MKSYRFPLAIVIATPLLVVLAGCAKPPQELMTSVDQAFAAAETSEAARYAETEISAAREALASARAELDAQTDKFAMTRSYDEATRLYNEAQTLAQKALETAQANRAAAETAANETIARVHTELAEATSMVEQLGKCRRRPKDIAADTVALKAQLEGYTASLPEAERLVTEKNFLDAQSQAEALSSQVSTVLQDVRNAAEKMGCALQNAA